MSTLVRFRCQEPSHLAAPSRHGRGGLVTRHGTAAYCDGDVADERHHWVATGGVPLESLFRDEGRMPLWEDRHDDLDARTGHLSDELGHARSPARLR